MHGRAYYVTRALVRAVVWALLGVGFLLLLQALLWLAWIGFA